MDEMDFFDIPLNMCDAADAHPELAETSCFTILSISTENQAQNLLGIQDKYKWYCKKCVLYKSLF